MYEFIAAIFIMVCLPLIVALERNLNFVVEQVLKGIDTVKGWMYG
jgi:hypothetical protein